jgi:hypothetical protein
MRKRDGPPQIEDLQRMTAPQLQAMHRELFGAEHRIANCQHLRRKIAWHMQAAKSGGLPESVRQYAIAIARGTELRSRISENASRRRAGVPDRPKGMSPGARKIWDALVDEMASSGVLRTVDALALVQLCEDQAMPDTLRQGMAEMTREIAKKVKEKRVWPHAGVEQQGAGGCQRCHWICGPPGASSVWLITSRRRALTAQKIRGAKRVRTENRNVVHAR